MFYLLPWYYHAIGKVDSCICLCAYAFGHSSGSLSLDPWRNKKIVQCPCSVKIVELLLSLWLKMKLQQAGLVLESKAWDFFPTWNPSSLENLLLPALQSYLNNALPLLSAHFPQSVRTAPASRKIKAPNLRLMLVLKHKH